MEQQEITLGQVTYQVSWVYAGTSGTALGPCPADPAPLPPLPEPRGERVCSIRQAIFSPHETVAAEATLGRVCASPTVACPPPSPSRCPGSASRRRRWSSFAAAGWSG